MHLPRAFYKFPLRFDVARLSEEVSAFPEEVWRRHPQDYRGNSALPLIATHADPDSNGFELPMEPTKYLRQSPYICQVFDQFRTLLGRARLMRLEPGSGVPEHIDSQYYWRTHTRVHIPIVTHPDIRFHCGRESVHMAAGEAWTFDNWLTHRVVNETGTRRIHLTFDTYGSANFWEMARAGSETPRFVPFREGAFPELIYETYEGDPVMAPSELDLEFSKLTDDVAAFSGNDPAAVARLRDLVSRLRNDWRIVWHLNGPTREGAEHFAAIAQWTQGAIMPLAKMLRMESNGYPLGDVLPATFGAMINAAAFARLDARATAKPVPRFDRPIFVVSAPRAGSTLLFEMLSGNESLWTLGGEGHAQIETIAALRPENRDFDSNRLTEADATDAIRAQLLANFAKDLRSAGGKSADGADAIRFLEKTPKNALRIPFFKALFPDAKFIFLHREARANISAIMEAWRSDHFVTYAKLPDRAAPWSLLLIPGWRALNNASLAEIAMRQWRDTNEIVLSDLAALPPQDWCAVRYEDIVADPKGTLERLCGFADIPFDQAMQKIAATRLAPSRYSLSPPDPQKWRKNEAAMAPFLSETIAASEKLGAIRGARQAAQ